MKVGGVEAGHLCGVVCGPPAGELQTRSNGAGRRWGAAPAFSFALVCHLVQQFSISRPEWPHLQNRKVGPGELWL